MLVARTQIIFDGVWGPSSEPRTHFSPSKMADFYGFFPQNFCKSGLISKGFLPQKCLILQFFRNFCEWDSLLRIFLAKMGPMSKDFW